MITRKQSAVQPVEPVRHLPNPCAPGAMAQPAPGLSLDEQILLDAYRHLPPVPRLAVRRYILWRDIRLARAIYHRVFLNVALGQLRDQPPD